MKRKLTREDLARATPRIPVLSPYRVPRLQPRPRFRRLDHLLALDLDHHRNPLGSGSRPPRRWGCREKMRSRASGSGPRSPSRAPPSRWSARAKSRGSTARRDIRSHHRVAVPFPIPATIPRVLARRSGSRASSAGSRLCSRRSRCAPEDGAKM